MFSKCQSGKELSFPNVNWKSWSDSVGLGEDMSICTSDKLPRVAYVSVASLLVAKRMDWIISIRKFPETVEISRVHLEMMLNLKGRLYLEF